MPRRSSLFASVSAAALGLALLTQTSSARAEPPVIAPPAPIATPTRVALTTTSATPMGSLMIVLDVLGIMEKEAPPPSATTRTATFLSPEPPKTPLFYSSLTVAKF